MWHDLLHRIKLQWTCYAGHGSCIPGSNSKLKNLDLKYLKKRLEATNWAENKAYRFDVDSRDDPVISPDPFDSKNNHGSQLHNQN